VTPVPDHLRGWCGVRAQQTPSHRAAAVFGTQLETDLIMGPVRPQGRPHDQRWPAGLKDLRGDFAVSQIEPGAAAGMARIGQCLPDHPGRRGLCLLLAGKFFHAMRINRANPCTPAAQAMEIVPMLEVAGACPR